MPLLDTYSTAVVLSYDSTQYANILWWQMVAEDVPGADMFALFTAIQDNVVPEWQKFLSDGVSFDSCVVRRLAPGVTDVFESSLSGNGDVVSNPLPGTNYVALNYYSDPYEKGSHYHFKLNGIPQIGHNQGRLTENQLVLYGPFINLLKGGPIDIVGEQFQLINSKDALDGLGNVKPVVNKMNVTPVVRNLRTRQMRSIV